MRTLGLALLVSLIGAAPPPVDPLPVARRVLFIGNSLTSVNDFPATVAAIARAAGDSITVGSVTGPGLALIDQFHGATQALAAIRAGHWDYVVLQQGPTSTGGVCEDTLVLAARLFAAVIDSAGARTALFMVWPARDRLPFFDSVRKAYQRAARAAHGVFLPAGEAWRSAWARDPGLPLYGPDDFHPSPTGTVLAGLEIYERLSGKDLRTLPPVAFANGMPLDLPERTVRLLEAAAHDANERFPAAVGANADAAPRPHPTVPGPGTRC